MVAGYKIARASSSSRLSQAKVNKPLFRRELVATVRPPAKIRESVY
jgi:hypothetical protein